MKKCTKMKSFFMSEISFHCCVSPGSKGIFCSVHFGKSLKWGSTLVWVSLWVWLFQIPWKKYKGGSYRFMYLHLLLTDTLYYRIQVGLKREVSYMCECVFLAISPKKSVVRVVGNFTQMGTKGHRMVLLAMAFSAATTITPPPLRRVFGLLQILTWFNLVKGA